MTEYVYYAEAHQVPVLEHDPLDLSSTEQAAIRDLVANSHIAVRAAHLYNRKGFFATDDFTGHQNPAYRSDNDDIVVQVTVVIPADHAHREKHATLRSIYDRVQASVREAEVAQHQAEVAQAEADLAAAQARLDAVRRG